MRYVMIMAMVVIVWVECDICNDNSNVSDGIGT